MTPLTAFLTRLMPRAPGCPQPTALQALLDSALEFCDRTRAIRVTTSPASLVRGQAVYYLDLPRGVEPLMYVRAWVGTNLLRVPTQAHRWAVEQHQDDGAEGTPQVMLPDEDGAVRVHPAPDAHWAGRPLVVQLAVRPAHNATDVMDELFTTWRDAVVGGALSRLCSIPNQSYSNPAAAAEGALMFASGVSRARSEANRGMSSGHVRAYNQPLA